MFEMQIASLGHGSSGTIRATRKENAGFAPGTPKVITGSRLQVARSRKIRLLD